MTDTFVVSGGESGPPSLRLTRVGANQNFQNYAKVLIM